MPFLSLGGNLRDIQPTLLSPSEPPPGILISHGNPSVTPKAWQRVLQVLCNCIMRTCQPLPRFSCPFQGMNLWTGDTRASPGLCCGSSGQQCCVHDALLGEQLRAQCPRHSPGLSQRLWKPLLPGSFLPFRLRARSTAKH